MLAQAAKRSHDVGNSVFYILIPFYALYLFFGDSEYGENQYGPNPKGIGNQDDVLDYVNDTPSYKDDKEENI